MQPDPSSHRHEQETFGGGEAASGALFEGDSPAHRASTVPADESNGIGRVGRYTLLRVIGQGGMGSVYLAQQDVPRRMVALKLLRPELLTPALLRRFEMESQTLARLQHPGIAQIYDAGAAQTAAGAQPFFAMEYIKGRSLVEYAAAAALTLPQRLELFIRVCDAVQHAHAKGMVHRDLKPANILVTDQGEPKILDFGVARLTDKDIAGATMHTEVGQLVGTLPYMSPEQVAGVPDDVDTRSDVYALGVVLFELLTGRLPYEVAGKMVPEAARIIREEDPTRLSSVNRHYRGDVETIVGKALEKDRLRRYQTAAALSADLGRYLRDEPIVARPSTTWYQVRKFAQRHRALVGGVAAVFVVLVAGVVVSQMLLARALIAEERAHEEARQAGIARAGEQQRRVEAEQAKSAADRAARRAMNTADVLRSIIVGANAERGGRANLTLREVLDTAVDRLRRDLANDPELLGAFLLDAGTAYTSLDLPAKAREVLKEAIGHTASVYGEASEQVAAVHEALGQAVHRVQDANSPEVLEEAREHIRQAKRIYERIGGPNDPRAARAEGDLQFLDNMTSQRPAASAAQPATAGRWSKGELSIQDRFFLAAWAASTNGKKSADDLLDELTRVTERVRALWREGERDESHRVLREYVAAAAKEAQQEDRAWLVAGGLAQRQFRVGDLELCEIICLEAEKHFAGPGGRPTINQLTIMSQLGDVEHRRKRYAHAVKQYRRALQADAGTLPPDHTVILTIRCNLTICLVLDGKIDEAESEVLGLLKLTEGSSRAARLPRQVGLEQMFDICKLRGDGEGMRKYAALLQQEFPSAPGTTSRKKFVDGPTSVPNGGATPGNAPPPAD
ncbi:MAG: serine/threonine protein kinase [Phycisphaeraceae bacterium]|nr:serine/threonine protein kinase [Phycisphaeraceae bacterium]